MTPMTKPGERALNPAIDGKIFCKKGVTTTSAKYPYTTVGTAAKISREGFITARKPFGAYSFRYMAIVSPIGSATETAIAMIKNVPERRGSMPKCFCVNSGVHSVLVKNSVNDTDLKNKKDWEKGSSYCKCNTGSVWKDVAWDKHSGCIHNSM